MSQEQLTRKFDNDDVDSISASGKGMILVGATEANKNERAADLNNNSSTNTNNDDNKNNYVVVSTRTTTTGVSNITIGEALEASALTAGHRAVDYSDAAAIQAAEVRATGRTNIVPGGVAAAAQSAATRNARITRDEDKTKLAHILSDASAKLPSDKPVTRRDAEGVIGAELRNDPNLCTHPGGVAASVAAAARLNQTHSQANPDTNANTTNNK